MGRELPCELRYIPPWVVQLTERATGLSTPPSLIPTLAQPMTSVPSLTLSTRGACTSWWMLFRTTSRLRPLTFRTMHWQARKEADCCLKIGTTTTSRAVSTGETLPLNKSGESMAVQYVSRSLHRRHSTRQYVVPASLHGITHTSSWLAQDGVALMDLATERPHVSTRLNSFLQEYSATGLYDGYRVDAVKHVSKQFQHDWCQSGGQFCIGEYFDRSTDKAAELTRGQGIDSVFGFGELICCHSEIKSLHGQV